MSGISFFFEKFFPVPLICTRKSQGKFLNTKHPFCLQCHKEVEDEGYLFLLYVIYTQILVKVLEMDRDVIYFHLYQVNPQPTTTNVTP